MGILTIIYILVFLVFALVAFAAMQIKLAGMQIKDFWGFIEANQMLDKLYHFAKQYQNMSPQEQVIYLAEAEKIFFKFLNLADTVGCFFGIYSEGINFLSLLLGN